MMKKILCGMMAFAMLFATSCENDTEIGVAETSNVAIKVGMPEISRAYSDGTTATVLQYAVYDAEGNELEDLTVTDGTINGTATVSLQLATGNTYAVVFWAAAPEAPYTVDFATKSVAVNYEGVKSNDENLDAFCKYQEFTVTGPMSVDVELTRPFAQLNIGAADFADAASAGFVPTASAVTVKNVYSTLDLATGAVSDEVEVTFAENAVPAEEVFPVAGNEYIAMNYLLVAADKEVVEVEFTYTDGVDEKSRTVGSVPVQRNHRTNIYGNILTSKVDVNIEINPDYEDPNFDIIEAFTTSGEYTLPADVVIAKPLVVTNGAEVVLNLNGKTLKNMVENTATDVIIVEEGSSLTINGEGVVEAVSGNDGYTVIVEGKLVVNGGTFKSGVDADGAPNAVIYVRGNGEAYINGGNFPNDNTSKFVLNKKDADRATTVIEVRGGTFTKFNPENNAAEGANTNFMAEGYMAVADGDVYTVVSCDRVVDGVGFQAALKNGTSDVVLLDESLDVSGTTTPYFHVYREVVIDMEDNTLTVSNDKNYGIFCNAGSKVTFENSNIVAKGGAIVVRDGADVVFNGNSITINSTNTAHRHMFYAYGEGTTITINAGTFSFDAYRKRTYGYIADGAVLYINGGVFGPAPNHPTDANAPFMVDGGQVIITGGTFGFDPTEWVAEGYVATQNGSTWTVAAK